MADATPPAPQKRPSEIFPELEPLEKQLLGATLEKQLMEARTATAKALAPDLSVDPGTDTVTFHDRVTGLDRVLVHMNAGVLADDIADLTLEAIFPPGASGQRACRIRVVEALDALDALDAHRLLSTQIAALAARVDVAAPPPQEPAPTPEPGREEAVSPTFAPAAAAGAVASAVIGAGVKGIGLATTLMASNYHLSGREVTADTLGLDLVVAGSLVKKARPGETVAVVADRVTPTPAARIATDLAALVDSAAVRLAPVVLAARAAAARAEAEVSVRTDRLAALDSWTLELVKRVGAKDTADEAIQASLAALRAERTALIAELPARQADQARAVAVRDALADVAADVEGLVAAVTAPAPDGARPVLWEAARGEALMGAGDDRVTHLLYVRPVAAGIDQSVVDRPVKSDTLNLLAGTTAEFALVELPGARVVLAGSRSMLQATSMKVGDPGSFTQKRPNYLTFDRQRQSP